VLIKRL